jgi:carbon-monoxide dehydrogenase medium subunit
VQNSHVHFFQEFARRHGDYAIAGLAAHAEIEAGVFTDLRPAFFAVGDRPLVVKTTDRLINATVTPKLLSEVSGLVGDEFDPQDDQQASGSMRRHLASVLLTRCIATMLGRPELARGAA